MNIKVKTVGKFFEVHMDDKVYFLNEQDLRHLRNQSNTAIGKLVERRKRHARQQTSTG